MAKEVKEKEVNATALLKKVEAGETLSSKELGAMLSKLNASDENEITADYLAIEVGEQVRVFFVEMTEIKSIKADAKDGDMSPAVRFVNEDGSFAINADAVIVSTCSKLKKITPLQITCTGKGGTKGREYKNFKIIALD